MPALPVEPIPVDLVLGGVQLTEPRLDRSGQRLLWIESTPDSSTFMVVGFDDDGTPSAPTAWAVEPAPAPGRGLGGGTFDWLADGDGVVYIGTDDALWLARFATATSHVDASRLIWSAAASGLTGSAQAPEVSPDGDAVVFMVDQRHIVVRSLDSVRAAEPDRVVTAAVDAEFCFDPVFAPDGATVSFQAWSPPDMAWDGAARVSVSDRGEVTQWRPDDAAVQQVAFAPDGTPVCITDATGWLNVWWADRPLLVDEAVEHAGPTWGPRQRSFAVAPDATSVAFTRNEAGFGRLCVAAVDSGVVTELGRGVHGQVCWRGERITALRTGARTPTEIVEYRPALDGSWSRRTIANDAAAGWAASDVQAHLVEPELVEVAVSGVTLYARRYASGTPSGRTIVWVHGGPTGQWDVSFLPSIAFWGSRGWDVLLVDPRGSTGHGRRYQQALHGGWGVLDVDDVAALIGASHERGWSSPSRTVVMGGSSGGLTVLGVLGRTPALVAGGVAVYPVSDLADLAVRSHRFELHYPLTLVGPLDDHERYAERSPQSYADRIAGPLLLMHGMDDPVVPVDQTITLAGLIRRAGGQVELHLFDGEGHGFRQPDNKRQEYRLTEAFLDRVVPAGRPPMSRASMPRRT